MIPIDDAAILNARGPKTELNPGRPYAWHLEEELSRTGRLEPVATVFLTNRECPFKCLMCDLWTHTLDYSVSATQILEQIRFAVGSMPDARHIKLYNAGSFFDRKAIPPAALDQIAALLSRFETVIVENHPALCGPPVYEFADRLEGQLEVAMGLETADPAVLARLNKRMTREDFSCAAQALVARGIKVRAFVLVRPPWHSEQEGLDWAVRSTRFAAQAGADVVTLIPTRAGNGIMDRLAEEGAFAPPALRSLEAALEQSLTPDIRVFADLWDWRRMPACAQCADMRMARIAHINRHQDLPAPLRCAACEE